VSVLVSSFRSRLPVGRQRRFRGLAGHRPHNGSISTPSPPERDASNSRRADQPTIGHVPVSRMSNIEGLPAP
jgi:hypothetical protein